MRISDWSSDLCSSDLLAAAQLAQANFTTDFRSDVRQINVPTRIIHGDRDASAPLALTARATAALLPHATLRVYEGAPHGLPLTPVEPLNAELLGFLGSAWDACHGAPAGLGAPPRHSSSHKRAA